jgi:hypothetical protein
MHSSLPFTTTALDGDEWSASLPGCALPPGKGPRFPLDRRLGGPQSRSWHRGLRKKSSCLCQASNLDRPVALSVVKHYIDWATPVLWVSVCKYRASIFWTGSRFILTAGEAKRPYFRFFEYKQNVNTVYIKRNICFIHRLNWYCLTMKHGG